MIVLLKGGAPRFYLQTVSSMDDERTWFGRFQHLCRNTYDVPRTDHKALFHIATECKTFDEVKTFLEGYESYPLAEKIVQLKTRARTMTHLLNNSQRVVKRPSFLPLRSRR